MTYDLHMNTHQTHTHRPCVSEWVEVYIVYYMRGKEIRLLSHWAALWGFFVPAAPAPFLH